MSDIVERLRKTPHLSSLEEEAADEIERLRTRNAEHEHRYDALEAMVDYYQQALSQAGDDIELAEAEQRGYVRGTKEIERLRSEVAKDTGTWQDLWKVERAANDQLLEALDHIQYRTSCEVARTIANDALKPSLTTESLVTSESGREKEPRSQSGPRKWKEPQRQSDSIDE